ncbi:MAG: phage capsid protein [Bacilli bacterium]
MKNNEILNKWTPVMEHESVPAITNSRKDIVAAILESQARDIAADPDGIYTDAFIVSQLKHVGGEMNEAVVTGDHSYTPDNIAAGKNSGAAVGIGPTVMGMVRRAIPNLIAMDVCGVQPMSQPTGQVFSLRALYGGDFKSADAKEAFHPMMNPDAGFSGAQHDYSKNPAAAFKKYTKDTAVAVNEVVYFEYATGDKVYLQNVSTAAWTPVADVNGATPTQDIEVLSKIADSTLVEIAEGMATSYAELCQNFNGSQDNPWNEMSFRIDKQTVEAKSRQLKAQYSIEMAQDLRAVHGLSVDGELSAILAQEIVQEINREIILWINATAQIGKTGWTNKAGGKAGVFDFDDANDVRGARWAGESYKALIVQIDKEANEIARQTGRGAGNFIIASRNLVAALGHTDMFVSVAQQGKSTGFETDTNRSVFAGVLAGKYRVYIDQYAKEDYFTLGYKGASEMDAGIYYSPYVAMTPFRGTLPNNFQPVMGFKTRYAIGINPLADSAKHKGFQQINNGMPTPEMFGKNCYFRRVYVKGL